MTNQNDVTQALNYIEDYLFTHGKQWDSKFEDDFKPRIKKIRQAIEGKQWQPMDKAPNNVELLVRTKPSPKNTQYKDGDGVAYNVAEKSDFDVFETVNGAVLNNSEYWISEWRYLEPTPPSKDEE